MLINKPKKAKYRLADDGNDVKAHAHLIVKNYGDNEDKTSQNIHKLIETLFIE